MRDKKNDYTYNRFKLNLLFLTCLFYSFEKTGYTLHSFIIKEYNDKLYDIEHVLTNLDIDIIKIFLNYILKDRK